MSETWDLPTVIGITYMSVQCLALLILSFAGYLYVTEMVAANEMARGDLTTKATFCKSWIKIVWKMRGVYSSFVVHIFDIATDLMVVTVTTQPGPGQV